jgi:hypothetical protein
MAEMAGKWMEDHKVKFIKKHVPTKVSYSLSHVHDCMKYVLGGAGEVSYSLSHINIHWLCILQLVYWEGGFFMAF